MSKKENISIDLNSLYGKLCPKCKEVFAAEVGRMVLKEKALA